MYNRKRVYAGTKHFIKKLVRTIKKPDILLNLLLSRYNKRINLRNAKKQFFFG